MHGAMKTSLHEGSKTSWLINQVRQYALEVGGSLNDLTIYFGNIDIRHHLCNPRETWLNPFELVSELNDNLITLVDDLKIVSGKITIVDPLPIEDESRVIPKSGWYMGKPFWGDWEERVRMRTALQKLYQQLREENPGRIEILEWPQSIYDGEKLSFEAMEKPRSVHLSQESYVYDLENRRMQR